MKIGFIARYDNSGLGILSWEMWEHLKPYKILAIENGAYRTFPERLEGYDVRFSTRNVKDEDFNWLLDGVDVLYAIETPYVANAYVKARKKGIPSVLMPMYESLGADAEKRADTPNLFLCPSLLDYREVSDRKVFLPVPINRQRVKFKQKKQAQIFVHNAGHGGMASRNGTTELLEAIPMVKNPDVLFVIRSQSPIECNDPRVKIQVGNVKNYWDLWGEGDVFVFPEKFNGLSLPINEALSAGMVVMSSNRFPFNEWIPTEPLIDVPQTVRVKLASRLLDYAIIKPEAIARKIDEYAMQDISKLSKRSDKIAEGMSWEKLLPEYLKVFEQVCQK